MTEIYVTSRNDRLMSVTRPRVVHEIKHSLKISRIVLETPDDTCYITNDSLRNDRLIIVTLSSILQKMTCQLLF